MITYVAWVSQVWQAVARVWAVPDPDAVVREFTTPNVAGVLGIPSTQWTADVSAIEDAFASFQELNLIRITHKYLSLASPYTLTEQGEIYLNKDISVLAQALNSGLSLTDEATRFLLAAVGLGQASTSLSVRRQGVRVEKIFEALQWPWDLMAPGRVVRLVDYSLEAKGLVTNVNRASGGQYELTPTYRAFVWVQQREKR